jgi:hypothetical protein
MHGIADAAAGLGIGTWNIGQVGSLRLVEAKGLDHSLWDRAAAAARSR